MSDRKRSVVVFDIDDTLYCEYDYVVSGVEQASCVLTSCELARSCFCESYLARFRSGERKQLIQAAASDAGIALGDEQLDSFLAAYRSQQPSIRLSETIRILLARLAPLANLAAISDGDAARQRAKVEALGLSEWLAPIVLTHELGEGKSKPHPAAYELIETSFPHARQYVYVGDNSRKDFHTPHARNWRAVQMVRPNRVHPSAIDERTVVCRDESELHEALMTLVA